MFFAPLLVLLAQAEFPPSAPQWVVVHRGTITPLSSPRIPQMLVMPSGAYIAAFTSIEHYVPSSGTQVLRSVDRGKSWTSGENLASVNDGALVVRGERLWVFGVRSADHGFGDVVTHSSSDLGRTWSTAEDKSHGLLQEHVRLLPNAGATVVIRDRVWRTITSWGLDSDHGTRRYSVRMASASLDSAWARAGNWGFNETIPLVLDRRDSERCTLQIAETGPGELTLFFGQQGAGREIARARVDRPVLEWTFSAADRGLPPDALNRRIARDEISSRFIALVGLPIGDPVGLYAERRCHVLALWTSSDLLTWESSGFLLRDATRDHFTIRAADWAIDGDDLLVIANVQSLVPEERKTAEQIVFLRVPKFRERTAWSPPLWGAPLQK